MDSSLDEVLLGQRGRDYKPLSLHKQDGLSQDDRTGTRQLHGEILQKKYKPLASRGTSSVKKQQRNWKQNAKPQPKASIFCC